jgi:hypothetical protein
MRRSEALLGLAVAPFSALAACAPTVSSGIMQTDGLPGRPTAFGSQLYPSDDLTHAIALLAACKSTLLRVTASADFAYFDALFAAAQANGMRVIVISEYASQPVDVGAYAANAVAFQRRYAAFNPMWEIWNEPNLQSYWGVPPDVGAYSTLAIATAKALRAVGARDVLSGGTSGVDVNWIYGLTTHGAFDALTGCAVHSYENPETAINRYLQASSLVPRGIQLYTTEACVTTDLDEVSFFRNMWWLHRQLSLPALVWCEFRDGTAGLDPPYSNPMGLVTSTYAPKPVYYTAQSTLAV